MSYYQHHHNKAQYIAGRNQTEAMVNASKAIYFQVKHEQRKNEQRK